MPFAAVDQHQVWHAHLGALLLRLEQLAVTPRQHLAHGGVIIARRDAIDLVAAVFGTLHFVLVKHHAGGLRVLAAGVADVKALDAQQAHMIGRQAQSLDQGPRARLLRALLIQQTRELNRRVLLRHIEPNATLLTRLHRDFEFASASFLQQRQQICI